MPDFDVQQVREAAALAMHAERFGPAQAPDGFEHCGHGAQFRREADAAMAVIVPAVLPFGRAQGLRLAAVYAQDYLHDADVELLQRVLYRFAAIDECAECDRSGMLRADPLERGVDHHPLAAIESQPQPDPEQDALPLDGVA